MKTLVCSLIAVLSVALGGGILAADEDQNVVTGTVVEVNESYMELTKESTMGGPILGFQYEIAYHPKLGGKEIVVILANF